MSKQPMYLPYLQEINIKNKKAHFRFNGGEETVELNDIHSILLYGETKPIDTSILETITLKGIPIIYHRRNMTSAMWIHSGNKPDKLDILTKQLDIRKNLHKRKHIAKKLLEAKFKSMEWNIPSPARKFKKGMTLEEIRNIEAVHAKEYWAKYFKSLNIKSSRRSKGDVQDCLNASSKFLSGILLRWVHYHNLSPFHGFLHEPSDYPSLIYDLMEPYRGYLDKAIFDIAMFSNKNDKTLMPKIINEMKSILDTQIYCDLTRQIVTFQELMHGVVLALRSYLLGESSEFMVPIPGKPNGGRPRKVNFKLYGRKAGVTNYNLEAKQLSINFEEKLKIQ